MKKVREKIRELTASKHVSKEAETVVGSVNRVLRGYLNYYRHGTTYRLRWALSGYVRESVRDWIVRKHAKPRRETGTKRSQGAGLWTKVNAAQALLIDVFQVARNPASRSVACVAK